MEWPRPRKKVAMSASDLLGSAPPSRPSGVGKDKLQLLTQAIAAAASSLNLAKQLLSEIERQSSFGAREVSGLVGKYDGIFMVTEAGKKYPVPDNYAARTKLVYGDKLKMIEGPEGRRFKLIEEVSREEKTAKLILKDGRFEASAGTHSYKLIQSSIHYWSGVEGDEVKILLPKDEKHVPFAALVEVVGKQPGEGGEKPKEKEPAPKREISVPEKKAPAVQKPPPKKPEGKSPQPVSEEEELR